MPSWIPASGTERGMWMLLFLLAGGYLLGQWLNRQQTKRAGTWVQAGLKTLGGRVTWHWSKTLSAGAEANVEEARAPYRNLAISYYLVTREFAPLWLWERFRGKRDLLSVRANLRLAPAREFEIVPLGGPLQAKLDQATGTSAGAQDGAQPDGTQPDALQPFQWHELSSGLGLGMRGAICVETEQKAKDFLNTYGAHVERVSLRKRKPNLIAFFRLGPVQARPSAELWQALAELTKG